VKTVALAGRANRIIVDYAVNEDVGLIVGMSRSESDTSRWTIGSTADKVIRETSKPVLIISADAPTIKRESNILNRVLISLDGSHASEAILPYVRKFMYGISKNAETEVTLLRVLPPSHHVPVGEAVVIVPYTDVELSQLKEQAESYLAGIGREFEQDGIIVHCDAVIRSISTADQILDFATKRDVNLIAMSTHGRTGISRLFLGTTTDRVLHSVKIPILLIKPIED
jgi:nucleotide-binding universal stress UspA family protein